MKKALHGCVLCRDCRFKGDSKPIDALSPKDMSILHYSSCTIDGLSYLVDADRKCVDYRENND